MGIKTVPHPPYSPDLAPCDFWLFPKLTGCHYETIEEMKETVTKVIGTLTQEDFHGAFQKLLERYNKCIAAGGDYFDRDESFMSVLSIKVSIQKKSGNLFNDPRTCSNPECGCVALHTNALEKGMNPSFLFPAIRKKSGRQDSLSAVTNLGKGKPEECCSGESVAHWCTTLLLSAHPKSWTHPTKSINSINKNDLFEKSSRSHL